MTKIPYCDEVYNPAVGCREKSAGCKNCYAARMAHRGMCDQHRGLTTIQNGHVRWNGKVNLVHDALEKPLHWKKPRRIFVGSMTDLFYKGVPSSYIERVFGVMRECRQHTFLVLTKRLERAASFPWPRNCPHIQLIASAEDQKTYDERVKVLVHKCAAQTKGVSLEPLLGPIDLRGTGRLHLSWVVVGGESGPGARPMDIEWAESILDQCYHAEVPVYFKQTGAVLARELCLKDRTGADPHEWPGELQVQEFPGSQL